MSQEKDLPHGGVALSGILTVEGVAAVLRCSIDTVRRIPCADLPYLRVGRKNLYLLEDVEALVRRRSRRDAEAGGASPDPGRVIDSLADNVRGRSR